MGSTKNTTPLQPYDAAGLGPRLISWTVPSTGPNTVLQASLERLRNRARHEVRNNPWIKQGIRTQVIAEIGKGITPHSRTDNPTIRQAIKDLWMESCGQLDADGVTNFYGMESIISSARNLSGEVFIRRRRRRVDTPGLAVPIQFQILEADFVPIHKNELLSNGNRIQQGIEFNRLGQRVAYHMYLKHPGDALAGFIRARETIRVPANQIIHHFVPTRPGQIRGEIVTAQSLLAAKDFREYSDVELTRKRTRAPFTGFATREVSPGYQYDDLVGNEVNNETHPVTGSKLSPPPVDITPGTILAGHPGEKIELFNADDNGQGYKDYMRWKLLELAAGVGVPYEIMSGDWSGVNDRLVRAILNEFHRAIEGMQDQFMIHQVCMGCWAWWMEWAVFTNKLSIPDFADDLGNYLAVEWRPHAWPYVHPEQDIKAAIMAINADISSTSKEAAKRGVDAEDNIRENAETRAKKIAIYEELGVDLPEELALSDDIGDELDENQTN